MNADGRDALDSLLAMIRVDMERHMSVATKSRSGAFSIPCRSTDPRTVVVVKILTRKTDHA